MKTITGIKASKGRLDVFLDGEFAFSLSPAMARQANLALEQTISASRAKALQEADLLHRALNAAMRFLSYRPRTEAEVKTRLHRLKHDPAVVEKAISMLKLQGLINDAEFASFWQQNRQSFSPRSSRLIRAELLRKGVPREVISDALSAADDDAAAYRAGQKKARSLATAEPEDFRRKLGAFLLRRGFSFETAGRTVERLWQELEESR